MCVFVGKRKRRAKVENSCLLSQALGFEYLNLAYYHQRQSLIWIRVVCETCWPKHVYSTCNVFIIQLPLVIRGVPCPSSMGLHGQGEAPPVLESRSQIIV